MTTLEAKYWKKPSMSLSVFSDVIFWILFFPRVLMILIRRGLRDLFPNLTEDFSLFYEIVIPGIIGLIILWMLCVFYTGVLPELLNYK